MVECHLAKVDVASSNLVYRSRLSRTSVVRDNFLLKYRLLGRLCANDRNVEKILVPLILLMKTSGTIFYGTTPVFHSSEGQIVRESCLRWAG